MFLLVQPRSERKNNRKECFFFLSNVAHCLLLYKLIRHKKVIMNDRQKDAFTHNMIESMFNTVNGKKIAIFGFAFKKDTGDVRETPAIRVCELLMEDGAICHVYDPKVEIKGKHTCQSVHIVSADAGRLEAP